MNLQEITTKVQAEAEKKSDLSMKLSSVIPMVEGTQVKLKMGRNTEKYFTRTGLSSYLSRIDVPLRHFHKCSTSLKQSTLNEFHCYELNQPVLLRLYEDKIRYVASSSYTKFDDVDVMEALNDVEMPLRIREYSQTEDFFVLRATTENPIILKGLRPFYPGIQISNSEVGKSAVKVQYILWEEVCTNGMIVELEQISFSMRHRGSKKKSVDKLKIGVFNIIKGIDTFKLNCTERLLNFTSLSGDILFNTMKKDPRIPKTVTDSMLKLVCNYSKEEDIKDAAPLDVLSSFTEAIQSYNWDARNSLEKVAGEYLWAA